MKRLKSILSAFYEKMKQKHWEKIERMWNNEKDMYCMKKLYQELKDDTKNNNYNVFVYDTILYPPGSSSHHRFN